MANQLARDREKHRKAEWVWGSRMAVVQQQAIRSAQGSLREPAEVAGRERIPRTAASGAGCWGFVAAVLARAPEGRSEGDTAAGLPVQGMLQPPVADRRLVAKRTPGAGVAAGIRKVRAVEGRMQVHPQAAGDHRRLEDILGSAVHRQLPASVAGSPRTPQVMGSPAAHTAAADMQHTGPPRASRDAGDRMGKRQAHCRVPARMLSNISTCQVT